LMFAASFFGSKLADTAPVYARYTYTSILALALALVGH
jgi:hypothetical protein